MTLTFQESKLLFQILNFLSCVDLIPTCLLVALKSLTSTWKRCTTCPALNKWFSSTLTSTNAVKKWSATKTPARLPQWPNVTPKSLSQKHLTCCVATLKTWNSSPYASNLSMMLVNVSLKWTDRCVCANPSSTCLTNVFTILLALPSFSLLPRLHREFLKTTSQRSSRRTTLCEERRFSQKKD